MNHSISTTDVPAQNNEGETVADTSVEAVVGKPQQTYSRGYLAYVLGMVFTINIFNMTDRLIMGVVLEPIKMEFGLSDLQLGILSGLAFTIVYSTIGIPMGSVADRVMRRNLVAACVGLWSAMTVTCGIAASYMQMILARAGVAFGESGFTPAIHSMLSDYFPPSRRAMALAVYGVGAPIGSLLGNSVGGFVADNFGWRVTFLAVGAPGILLAALFLLTIREPVRGNTENRRDPGMAPSLPTAIAFAWRARSIRYLMLGAGAHLLVFYGLAIWLAPFLIRLHGLSLTQAGLWIGVITGVFGGAGTLVGGFASDRLARSNMGWYGWLNAFCLLFMLPFGVGMYLWPSATGALAFGCGVAFLGAVWLAPTFAVVQLVSPLRMRGVVAGVLIFTQNMIGLGCGPVLVGWLSDLLSPRFGTESLRWAMFGVFFVEIIAVALYFKAGRWIRHDLTAYRQAE